MRQRFVLSSILLTGILFVSVHCSREHSKPMSTQDTSNTRTTEIEEGKYSNRLLHSSSPYLLQHAHNPVDWYPWGKEALAKARKENKPILLSVGYSACHWCHVMEEESFEDEAIAAILNTHFISIKVDREERPDIDAIYMQAVQLYTRGHGGWPMTLFLTPDLNPFFGATYIPPKPFKDLCLRIAELWQTETEKLYNSAEELRTLLQQSLNENGTRNGKIDMTLLDHAAKTLASSYDSEYGGFGEAPKFPSSMALALLLRYYRQHPSQKQWLAMVTLTLDKMADGGIYDQLGGGFHRYATDRHWTVPHFEKMLYDNALLSMIYLEAYQVTERSRYRQIVQEILDYISGDLTSPQSGFYSSEDADSEGEEGKFYLWRKNDILKQLGDEDGRLFCRFYQVKDGGNFNSHETYHKGLNILHRSPTLQPQSDLWKRIQRLRTKLLPLRGKRVRPGRDDKILVAWNALTISAYAKAYQVLGKRIYYDRARNAANFILKEMQNDKTLLRSYAKGKASIPAFLPDYAFFINALIDLYESDFDTLWLHHAGQLMQTMLQRFWDKKNSGFFFADPRQSDLITTMKTSHDGAIPSGYSMAIQALLRLAALHSQTDYLDKAKELLSLNADKMKQSPQAYMQMLCNVDFFLSPTKEIIIVGRENAADTEALLSAVQGHFIPNKILSYLDPEKDNRRLLQEIPILKGKKMLNHKATAFVCEQGVCKLPRNDIKTLLQDLTMQHDAILNP